MINIIVILIAVLYVIVSNSRLGDSNDIITNLDMDEKEIRSELIKRELLNGDFLISNDFKLNGYDVIIKPCIIHRNDNYYMDGCEIFCDSPNGIYKIDGFGSTFFEVKNNEVLMIEDNCCGGFEKEIIKMFNEQIIEYLTKKDL